MTAHVAQVKILPIMELFGSSGIRAIADRQLIELGFSVGLAVGLRYRKVVVGSDSRTSGGPLKHALVAGLLAGGAAAHDAGLLPTPTLALAGRDFAATAMVTASHNPPEYNGIKLLNPDGSGFDAAQRRDIEDLVANRTLQTAPWQNFKSSTEHTGGVEKHIERILQDFPGRLKLRVALDCACGAASVITPYLLNRLGCEVISLNCYPSGFFPHDVEPTTANLKDLARVVREFGADLGIAHDGDADRMMVVDDRGHFVEGDKLLAIFARSLGARRIITTVDASMAVDELGLEVNRTRVGDVYVSEELRKGGDFGGEPSGAWIFPQVSLCPDGVYAAGRILAIAAESRISELEAGIPRYPLQRGSISSRGLSLAAMKENLLEMKPESVSSVDGIRLSFDSGWVLVRPSGTEPKVRITAEARTEQEAKSLYDRAVEIMKRSLEEQR